MVSWVKMGLIRLKLRLRLGSVLVSGLATVISNWVTPKFYTSLPVAIRIPAFYPQPSALVHFCYGHLRSQDDGQQNHMNHEWTCKFGKISTACLGQDFLVRSR